MPPKYSDHTDIKHGEEERLALKNVHSENFDISAVAISFSGGHLTD